MPTLLAVPNVSEGRDAVAVAEIADAFAAGGAELLDIHSDPDHNRSVVTLKGEPGALSHALLAGAREAVDRIDLNEHNGLHPHVGAVDVAPVVFLDDADRGAACAEALLAAARPPAEVVKRARRLLALAHCTLGEVDEAIRIFTEWLEDEPDDAIARHMLAACTGQGTPERASDAYVAQTFDSFARSFESKLAQLSYRAPMLVSAVVDDAGLERSKRYDVLDAGCGTGLCGPMLAPYARRLVGVDLSAGMLTQAAAKQVYDELLHGELTAYLRGQRGQFDVIVSADTLVYFGPLEAVAEAAAAALRRTLGEQGVATRELRLSPQARMSTETLAPVQARDTLVLWLRPQDLLALEGITPAGAQVFVSATLAGRDEVPLSAAWKARTLMAYPFELPQQRAGRVAAMRQWLHERGVPLTDERVQADAFVACRALRSAMLDAQDHLGRDYLVERIENDMERTTAVGLYPRLALGIGQRFASKTGYLVRFDEGQGGLVPVGERIAP